MKIILSSKEASLLEDIMEKVETGSTELMRNSIKDNPLISTKLIPLTGQVEVTIKREYMEDFLEMYESYIGIFVNQVKTLYEATCLLQRDAISILAKHTSENSETNASMEE